MRVIGEARGQQLADSRVIDDVLQQRLAEALHHAAMHLARDQHRIDDAAEIVEHVIGDDLDLAGLRVDLDLADMAAIGEGRRLALISAVAVEPVLETRQLLALQRHRQFADA